MIFQFQFRVISFAVLVLQVTTTLFSRPSAWLFIEASRIVDPTNAFIGSREESKSAFYLDGRYNFGSGTSDVDLPLNNVITFIAGVLHLLVDDGDEMGVRDGDFAGALEGHCGVKVGDHDAAISFHKANVAQLAKSIIAMWEHMRLSGQYVCQFVLHNSAIGVESIAGEVHP